MKFIADHWIGNKWPCIEIDPVDAKYFLLILRHLSATYDFEMPSIEQTLDGGYAEFQMLGTEAEIGIDNWTFSVAFKDISVRDKVLAELKALPEDFFT